MNRKIFLAALFLGFAASLLSFTETAEAKKMSIRPLGIRLTLPKTWKKAKWSFTQRKELEGCPGSPPWNGVWIQDNGKPRRSFIVYEAPKEFTVCPDIDEEWKMMKKKRKKYRYYWIDAVGTDPAIRKEQKKIAKSVRFIRRQPPSIILDSE